MGYLPFHDVHSSDHRGYFVDLDLAGLFDRRLPTIVNPLTCILKATDPLQVAKYIQALYSYLCEENIFKRLEKLEQSFDQEIYEKN